jgi:hypothetical protein
MENPTETEEYNLFPPISQQEKETQEFIGELEDIDEEDQPSQPTPKDPGQWSLFSSLQEATGWLSSSISEARSRWFGYQLQDYIRVVEEEKDIVLIQGVPYYTHTRYV